MIIKNIIIAGLTFLIIFTGCGKELPKIDLHIYKLEEIAKLGNEINFPIAVEDLLKRAVVFRELPQRIVSLVPAATEILFSVGAGDKVVGVTECCTYPPEAQSKEIIGGYSAETISIEKIIYLNPNLVIAGGEYHRTVITALENTGITVFSMEMRTIEDIYNIVFFTGLVMGNLKTAELKIEYMKDKENKIREMVLQIPESSRIKVFWEVWSEPLMTAGGGSFINELIETAGGNNIFSYTDAQYPVISTENVIFSNPEAIFGTHDNSELLKNIGNRTGWDTITAVKNRKIFILDDDIVSRPGPRMINALGLIAKNLYPDIFKSYFNTEEPLLW